MYLNDLYFFSGTVNLGSVLCCRSGSEFNTHKDRDFQVHLVNWNRNCFVWQLTEMGDNKPRIGNWSGMLYLIMNQYKKNLDWSEVKVWQQTTVAAFLFVCDTLRCTAMPHLAPDCDVTHFDWQPQCSACFNSFLSGDSTAPPRESCRPCDTHANTQS